VTEQVTAEEVRQLLLAYEIALDTADSLPRLVRIASRPRRWTLFEPLRRLPRPTVGTSSMVTYHVQRSTATLVRRYARIAATRGLTEEDERASGLVKNFRESLPVVRWKVIVPSVLIATFVAVQVVVGMVTRITAGLVEFLGRSAEPSGELVDRLAESLIRSLSVAPSVDSLIDLFDEFGKAGPAELLVLAATMITAGYLVVRPLSPAFRVKRIVFNLAATGHVDLGHTTMTWNVPRSVGLYQLERALFTRLGARLPHEIDLDLWVSAVPSVGLAWWLVAGGPLSSESTAGFGALVAAAAGLVAARIAWLMQTGRARRRTVSPTDPPAGFRAAHDDRAVEARSVLETAALGVASFLFLWVPFFPPVFVPSPVWVRLVRERRDLNRARLLSDGLSQGLPSRRVWPALGSGILLWLVPPVPLAIHLTHLMRLQSPGVGSARRTRAWLVPLTTAVTLLAVFDQLYFGSHFGKTWYGVTLIPALAVMAVVFGAVQHEHNVLAKYMGVPLPCDDPLLLEERTAEELHTAGAAPSHEALKSPWRPEHGVASIPDSGREVLYPGSNDIPGGPEPHGEG
jgi:hypothetical protein